MNLIPGLGRVAACLAAAGTLHAATLPNLLVNASEVAWDLAYDPPAGFSSILIQVEVFVQGAWAPVTGPLPAGYLGRIPPGGKMRLTLQDPPPLMLGVVARLQPLGGARGPLNAIMLSPITGPQEHRITARGMATSPWTGEAEPSDPNPSRRRARSKSLEGSAAQEPSRSTRPRLPAPVDDGVAPPAASSAPPAGDSPFLGALAPAFLNRMAFPLGPSDQAPVDADPASPRPQLDVLEDEFKALGTGEPASPVRRLDILEPEPISPEAAKEGGFLGRFGAPALRSMAGMKHGWVMVKNTTRQPWYLRHGSLPMPCVVHITREGGSGLPRTKLYPAGSYGLIQLPPGCTTLVGIAPHVRRDLWFEVVDAWGWNGWGDLVQICPQGTWWHCGGPAAVREGSPIVNPLPIKTRGFTIVRETWADSPHGEAGVPPPPAEAKAP